MEALTQAIINIGIAPAIAGYLLYDHSKKLLAIQLQLVTLTERIENQCEMQKEILNKVEKLSNK